MIAPDRSLRLRFLGGARIEFRNEPMTGRAAHRRRLAMLSILAASQSNGVSRDRLIGMLWPDSEDEKARRVLSEAVYVIRKDLGEAAIITSGAELSLNTEVLSCDVIDFRQAIKSGELDRAAGVYAGPFLASWYVEGAAEFERWAEDERRRLSAEYRTALLELAAQAEQSLAWEQSVLWLQRLVDEDPFSTRATLRLSHALTQLGERATALQRLAFHEELLRRELGVSPDAEFQSLQASLRQRTDAPMERKAQAFEASTGENAASGMNNALASPEPGTVEQPPSHRGEEARATHAAPSPPRLRLVRDGVDEVPVAAQGSLATALSKAYHGGWLALLLALAVALVTVTTNSRVGATQAESEVLDRTHVAVLYFDDHSEGRRLGYVADGLTEELIHELHGVRALRVVSRNGVKAFRRKPGQLDSIARVLRVGTIVGGSVQESDNILRVTAEVTDGRTGRHDTSLVIVRPFDELFKLQTDLAIAIAAVLRRRLGAEIHLRDGVERTASAAAQSLLQEARRLRDDAEAQQREPNSNVAHASTLLRQADSLLGAAERADLAWIRPTLERGWVRYELGRRSDEKQMAMILAGGLPFAQRALERVGRDSSPALHLRGTLRWAIIMAQLHRSPDSTMVRAAEEDLRAAIRGDSTLAAAWATLSQLLLLKGAHAESERAARRALAEDAYLDGAEEITFQLFAVSIYLGKRDDAKTWCLRGQVLYQHYWRFYECELVLLREQSGEPANPARAWQLVAFLDSIDPPSRARATPHPYSPIYRRMLAAAVSARAGDKVRARAEVELALEAVRGDAGLSLDILFDEAYVRSLLGEQDEAVKLLRQLIAQRPVVRETILRDPFFEPIAERLSSP